MRKVFILGLLLLFCFQTAAFAEKVYKASEDGAPISLDPVLASDKYANYTVTSIFDTLYEYKYLKTPFELKPCLAAAMPEVSEDGLTYTIKIKKGIFFTDDPAFPKGKGREVVAEDFVYTMKRHFDVKNKSKGKWLWRDRIAGLDQWGTDGADYAKPVEGLKAVDSHTIQIRLTKPYPQMVYTLAMGFLGVTAKEVVDHYGKEIGLHPVGSGPFFLKSFTTQKAVLLKNPNYREEIFDLELEGYDEAEHGKFGIKALAGKKVPIVDKVEFHYMKEMIPRWNSLNKGNEIQLGEVIAEVMPKVLASKNPVKLKPEFEKKFHCLPQREAGFVFNNFNMDNPEIGYNDDPKRNEMNKALRLAIRKGFDWNERIRRFYMGLGEAYPGIIQPFVDGYDPNLSKESIEYDPDGAKKLLKEAGWTADKLPKLEYHTTASTRMKQFFEQYRGFMKKIGYPSNKIKLVTYANFGDFSHAMDEGKCMFWGQGWGLDYPDAENTLQLYYGPNAGAGSNDSRFQNKEYDELYEKATVMQPSSERTQMYRRMNEILIEECANIASFTRTKIFLWPKDVTMYYRRDVINSNFKYVDVK